MNARGGNVGCGSQGVLLEKGPLHQGPEWASFFVPFLSGGPEPQCAHRLMVAC